MLGFIKLNEVIGSINGDAQETKQIIVNTNSIVKIEKSDLIDISNVRIYLNNGNQILVSDTFEDVSEILQGE